MELSLALQSATFSSSLGPAFKVLPVRVLLHVDLLLKISVLSLQRFLRFVGASGHLSGGIIFSSVLMEFFTPSSVLSQDYLRLVYQTEKCSLHTLDDFFGSQSFPFFYFAC